jgi:site-specific DNA-methyltransferase (adenine-specific)
MKTNHIYNENCLETMKKMPEGLLDMTLAGPPYDDLREYNGYVFDFEPIAKELYRVTKEGGVVVWIVADAIVDGSESGTSFEQALYFKKIGFRLHDTMIYEKLGGTLNKGTRYNQTFEYMFVFSKGSPKTVNLIRDKKNKHAGKTSWGDSKVRKKDGSLVSKKKKPYAEYGIRTNIWRYARGFNLSTQDTIAFQHPAIFPERLVCDHILSWSNEGDLVYDPFMGSGTTAKMCLLSNRKYLGSEISSEYCNLIEERLSSLLIYENQPSEKKEAICEMLLSDLLRT